MQPTYSGMQEINLSLFPQITIFWPRTPPPTKFIWTAILALLEAPLLRTSQRVPSGGGSCGKGRASDLCHFDAQRLVLWTPHMLSSDSATFLCVPWPSIASLPSRGPHFSSPSESAQAQSPQFLCLSPRHWVSSPMCLGCGKAKSVTENLCRQIIFHSATNLLQCKKTWGLSISVSGESKKDKHQGKHGNHYFPKLSWQGMQNRLKGGCKSLLT